MPAFNPPSQRDAMRRILLEHGYDKMRVLRAYASGDRRGEIPRKSDMNDMSPERYAEEVWADGHRPRSPWILEFCKQRGLTLPPFPR
jgi:hypothetical protein